MTAEGNYVLCLVLRYHHCVVTRMVVLRVQEFYVYLSSKQLYSPIRRN